MVLDQSAAFPHRRVEARSDIYVISANDGRLILRLQVNWRSIYGYHESRAEYTVIDQDSVVTIIPSWNQHVPTPTLDNIDVHTGNVSVKEYHQGVLDAIRGDGSRPGSAMLWTGAERTVDPQDLIELTTMISRMMPSL
jgi:hypothetical protein